MVCVVLVTGVSSTIVRSGDYSPEIASTADRSALTNRAAGYVRTRIGDNWYRGSAAVARHPQLLYSCAHVLWEDGTWAAPSNIEFHRGLHQASSPPLGGDSPRGYLHHANYSSEATSGSGKFDLDFSLLYGNSPFGPASSYYATGGIAAVETDHLKKIVGYPSRNDATGEDGHYYQHVTGPFPNDGTRSLLKERYCTISGVSTGPGNSGGPVYVQDEDGVYRLAAILVSGGGLFGSQSGVYALDDEAHSMGNDALERIAVGANGGSASVKKTIEHRRRLRIPDGKKKFSKRSVRAQGFSGHVRTLQLRTKFRAQSRGDLEIYLKPPSGRIHWVARGKGGGKKHLKVKKSYTGKLSGARANGAWKLYMRDRNPVGRSVFRFFSLTISD